MIPTEKRHFVLLSGASLFLSALAIWYAFSPSGRGRRIASSNAEARGGAAAWRAVKTMSMSGRLDAGAPRDPVKLALSYQNQIRNKSQGHHNVGSVAAEAPKRVQLPFTMELKRPRKSRLELRFAGQTAVQTWDGKSGWKLRPFLGRREVEPYSAEEARLAAEQADLDGLLIDASAKGNKVELVGTDKVDGKDAYNLKVTLPNQQVRHVWVDKHSYLDVRVDGERRLDGQAHTVFTYYRDYKRVDGLLIPHLLETVVDGVPGSEKIVIERVVLNPELADARFGRPDPGAADTPLAQDPTAAAAPNGAGADAHGHRHDKLARATRTTADYTIPQVTMQRDDGKSVAFPAELDDGRPVVLDFVFTNCATICPVMSQVFAQLQDKLGPARDKVHLVSISIDPEQDRPARLAEYAKKLHAGPEWRMYTGTAQASVALQKAFAAYRGDKMDHTPVTFLRGAPGQRWTRIDGFATADELADEVRDLLPAR